jgi:hypothetical protein
LRMETSKVPPPRSKTSTCTTSPASALATLSRP